MPGKKKTNRTIEKEEINEVCKDCRLFKEYGKNCYFYWDGKKYCPSKEE